MNDMKYGDKVRVWDDDAKKKSERIFVENVGGMYPYRTVYVGDEDKFPNGDFGTTRYKHAEPITGSQIKDRGQSDEELRAVLEAVLEAALAFRRLEVLRDKFAGQAMQGILSSAQSSRATCDEVADQSYQQASAMLARKMKP